MPRRKRTELVWSLDHACIMTSFSRTVIIACMDRGALRFMWYQGERVTTPEAVQAFLNDLMAGKHQSICVDGLYPFCQRGSHPVQPLPSVARTPRTGAPRTPRTDDRYAAQITRDIEILRKESKTASKQQATQ